MHNEGTEKRFARPPVFAKQSYICYKFTNKLLNLKIIPNLCHRSEFTDRVVSCNLNLRLTVKLS